MIDIRFLRENPEAVKENIRKKFQDAKLPLVDEVVDLDQKRRAAIAEVESLKAARNKLSKANGPLYGQLKKCEDEAKKAELQAQIDQNTEISKEFSLWKSSGTSYRRGNMFVIPINTSVLYVEPVYLEATNSSIPEVKRIIVAYDDKIAYEETLAECLVSLFGDEAEKGVETTEPSGGEADKDKLTTKELAALAAAAYENAQKAMQAGDWTKYGKYLDEMEGYLNELTK